MARIQNHAKPRAAGGDDRVQMRVFMVLVHAQKRRVQRQAEAAVFQAGEMRRQQNDIAGGARFGVVLYARNAPAKSMIRAMRAGLQFYYLPDQDPGDGQGVFAPFFSIPAATFGALGRLARLGAARVVPCATRLLPRGRGYEIIFAPPLENFPSGDEARDAAAMNRAIEELIALMPEQYLWSHRRFKTRPPGEPPFYA